MGCTVDSLSTAHSSLFMTIESSRSVLSIVLKPIIFGLGFIIRENRKKGARCVWGQTYTLTIYEGFL